MSIDRSPVRAQVQGPTTILVPLVLILVVFVATIADQLQQIGYSDLVAVGMAVGMVAVSVVVGQVVAAIVKLKQEVKRQ